MRSSPAARATRLPVRPPGHHAGTRGLIPGSVSCGFCVFNSVTVGAAHALRHCWRGRRPPRRRRAFAAAFAACAAAAAAGGGRRL